MRRHMLRWLLLAASLAIALSAAGLYAGWSWLQSEWYSPWPSNAEPRTARVEVAAGQTGTAILQELEHLGVISSARTARLLLVHRMQDPDLQAGEYAFALPASAHEVLQQIVRGDVVTYPVTVIEGLTLEETANHLAKEGFGRLDAFLEAMRDPSSIRDLDPLADDLEGYLYPDTYSFARGTSETEIVRTMLRNFRSRIEALPEQLPAESPTLRDLVILASIVEKEAQLPEERSLIAGVYANRLRIGMALYADPTIIYGLKKEGRWDGNLRRRDLEAESEYNTYKVGGLPPTPICSPRIESLLAAAHPSSEPFLYFVSRNDGSHVFARTLREHNRNVEVWQKQYWRDRWRREAEAKKSRGSTNLGNSP